MTQCERKSGPKPNSVTFVVPPRSVNPGGAVVPYGGPKQPNEDPSAKGLLPGRDCQQGTRGPQEDLNNGEFRTSPV